MNDPLYEVVMESLQITLLVLIMMTIVDAVNVRTRGGLAPLLKGAGHARQYVVTSLIGAVPGCMGAFTNVSLYVHGMISFGALAGSMAAVSGDEAFIMLALFPKTAILLFGILVAVGIVAGWLTDIVVKKWNIATCKDCTTSQFHPAEEGLLHFVKEHIWGHIVRKHLWKMALWTVGALLVVKFGQRYWHLEELTSEYAILLLFAGALLGLVPESGPHLIL